MANKRCVCGQSAQFPICDGSHKSEGWRCIPSSVELVRDAFVASPHLSNLADRLAHRFGGVSLHQASKPLRACRLFIVTDGIQLDSVLAHMDRIHTDELHVIGIGIEQEVLSWSFTDAHFHVVPAHPFSTLWTHVQDAVEHGESQPMITANRPRVFLSHAVTDEARIFPTLNILREQYGITPFICADSIAPGADWQATIEANLRDTDLLIVLASERVTQSVYCAYEVGLAKGLGKEIRIVNLDGSQLPPYLTQKQAIDVPRLLTRKPWLTESDALLHAILSTLNGVGAAQI